MRFPTLSAIIVLLALIFLRNLSECHAQDGTPAKPAFAYQEIVLENGLKVVSLEDFSCPIVAVQVWYHVGSKNEEPDRQGFAHMFEHMMFRGTDRQIGRAHV